MRRSWPFEGPYLTAGVGRGGRDRGRNPEVWTDSSHGSGAFMEDEPVEIVGDIGQDEFRFGPCDTDGADEQAEPVLLVGEDVFDMGPDRRFRGIGPRDILRHRLPRRLAPVNAADQHP